jgi:GNAT superfamily N-acetyltransferase
MDVIQAQGDAEIEQARALFGEYAAWLQISLCFQDFDRELAELPGAYAPPTGRLFLAVENEQVAGCVALRRIDPETAELKRLFVRPAFRGRGLGRTLTEASIAAAREIGYQRLRLDTLPDRMDQAVRLYSELGFAEIRPYYDSPVAGTRFMELKLT